MKYLLGSAAIAALLAAGLPAAAQTSNGQQPAPSNAPAATPQSGTSTAPAGDQTMPQKPGSAKHAMKHPTQKSAQAMTHKRRTAQDNMAEELNRQELARLQQGQAPASGSSMPNGTMPNQMAPKQ